MAQKKTPEYWTDKGYLFHRFGECEACGAKVEFWWRPGRLKKIVPLDAGTLEAHFAACPKAREHRFELKAQAGML